MFAALKTALWLLLLLLLGRLVAIRAEAEVIYSWEYLNFTWTEPEAQSTWERNQGWTGCLVAGVKVKYENHERFFSD
jgi:hypothetical protein